jgi:hypothetical protein
MPVKYQVKLIKFKQCNFTNSYSTIADVGSPYSMATGQRDVCSLIT